MTDLYMVLGVTHDANSDDIRAAYRNKVKNVHPDVGGSSEAFSKVAMAYEVLIDPARRKLYDESGSIQNQERVIEEGARIIVARLIDQLLEQENAKYLDVVDILCREIAAAVAGKTVAIASLEQRQSHLADLRDRFRVKASDENVVDQLIAKKIDNLSGAVASEHLSVAQLHAASALLRRYEFRRERPTTSDAPDLPEPVGQLLDLSDLWSGNISRKTSR